MKKQMKKKLTTKALYEIMSKPFVFDRLEALEQAQEEMEKRVEEIDKVTNTNEIELSKSINILVKRIDKMEKRMELVEQNQLVDTFNKENEPKEECVIKRYGMIEDGVPYMDIFHKPIKPDKLREELFELVSKNEGKTIYVLVDEIISLIKGNL